MECVYQEYAQAYAATPQPMGTHDERVSTAYQALLTAGAESCLSFHFPSMTGREGPAPDRQMRAALERYKSTVASAPPLAVGRAECVEHVMKSVKHASLIVNRTNKQGYEASNAGDDGGMSGSLTAGSLGIAMVNVLMPCGVAKAGGVAAHRLFDMGAGHGPVVMAGHVMGFKSAFGVELGGSSTGGELSALPSMYAGACKIAGRFMGDKQISVRFNANAAMLESKDLFLEWNDPSSRAPIVVFAFDAGWTPSARLHMYHKVAECPEVMVFIVCAHDCLQSFTHCFTPPQKHPDAASVVLHALALGQPVGCRPFTFVGSTPAAMRGSGEKKTLLYFSRYC